MKADWYEKKGKPLKKREPSEHKPNAGESMCLERVGNIQGGYGIMSGGTGSGEPGHRICESPLRQINQTRDDLLKLFFEKPMELEEVKLESLVYRREAG